MGNRKSTGILWLHGPSPALNSSIAQYVAQKRAQRSKLAASFFFDSLALSPLRGFRAHLTKALHEDPFINCRSFPTQVERLLLEPLRGVSATPPFLVIIDALDQCEGEENQREVLAQLARIVRAPRSPLRFIVTSTNAPHLRRAFGQPELKAVSSIAAVATNPTTLADALSSYTRVYLVQGKVLAEGKDSQASSASNSYFRAGTAVNTIWPFFFHHQRA
ncbi:hypothetical protein DXG01_012187 [Tephrocybe rancida]|nr:hypothetical protein DXG01_012187 [Tephrocybe rancida]